MRELEFLGRGTDSETLVFSDADGNRFSVAITEELRSSVRLLGTPMASKHSSTHLSPGEIQSLLRQGFTVEEIASTHSLEPEKIRRYEGPVQDEKSWVVRKTLSRPVTSDLNAPTLEELVINRLTARGVDPETMTWTASKRPSQNWEIHLTFVLGTLKREAHWRIVDNQRIQALDQESAWLISLSATDLPTNTSASSMPLEHFSLFQTALSAEEIEREALIDKLNAQRGHPQPIFEEIDGFGEEDEQGDQANQDNVTTLPMFGLRDGIEDIPEDSSVTGFLNRPDENYGAWEPKIVEPVTQNDVFAGIDEAVSLSPLTADSNNENTKDSSAQTNQNRTPSQDDEPDALTANFLFGASNSKTGQQTNQGRQNHPNTSGTPRVTANTGGSKTGDYSNSQNGASSQSGSSSRKGPDSSIFSVVNGGVGSSSGRSPASGVIPTIPAAKTRRDGGKSGLPQRKSVIQSTNSSVADRIANTGGLRSLSNPNTASNYTISRNTPGSGRENTKTGKVPVGENSKSERKSSNKRKPMPSWDEIVFGAKHE